MQDAPPVLDSLAAAAGDAPPPAVDSARATADSARPALDTTGVVTDTSGIGALSRDVGQATDLLREGRLDDALTLIASSLIDFTLSNLLPALVVAFLFWVVLRVSQTLISRSLQRSRRIDAGVQQLILRMARVVVLTFATITVLGELGIEVAALIAGLGIAGIALGFAAQDTIQNLIAGVTILLDRPFRVGDNIQLLDTFGTVEEITLRTTRVRTLDNQMVIIPNSKAITERVTNHSMVGSLRILIPFGIAYKESPQEARRVVVALADGDPRLHPNFVPDAVVTELGDSSVNMALRLHLRDPQLEVPVRLEYQEKVFEALKAAGISIPFPHLQLFIDEAKAFERSTWRAGDGA